MTVSSKKNIIRDFDRAAKNYDEHAVIQRKAADHLFSLIQDRLSNEIKAIDEGCGTGYFHELLRKNKIYCPLTQIDISFAMCKKADEYSSPREYGETYTCTADIESLPIADNSVDVAFSSLTLQWANDINLPLKETHRVLKENGSIAISTIGSGTLQELTKSFSQIDDFPHVNNNFITEANLQKALENSGFKKIKISNTVITIKHNSLRDLMQSIKGVGAGYKYKSSKKYLGKNYFLKLEEIYKTNFGKDGLLPASWNIIYAVAGK